MVDDFASFHGDCGQGEEVVIPVLLDVFQIRVKEKHAEIGRQFGDALILSFFHVVVREVPFRISNKQPGSFS